MRWAPWLVFSSTLVARMATAARFPTEWDSAQFVLGVDRFDVTQDSPNAPGYWSYVALARLVRAVTPLDAHAALVLVVAVASAATGALLFLAARQLGGEWLAWVAAALWAANPVAWFYGSVANAKVFDAAALAGLLVLALRARAGGRQAVWAAAYVGVAAGFRPSSVLVLAPLALLTLLRCSRRPADLAVPLVVAAAAVAAWLVPAALEQPGGLAALRATNEFMFELTAAKTSIFFGAPLAAARENAARALVTAAVAVAPVLPVFVLGLVATVREPPGARRPLPVPTLLAAALPGSLLVTLLHFGTAGFTLSHLPATLLLLLAPAAALGPRGRRAAIGAVVVVTVLGAQRFLYADAPVPLAHPWAPSGLTLAEIRRVDDDSRRAVSLGPALDPSRDVLVFVQGNGFERFRPLSVLLPQYASHLVAGGGDAMSTYRGRAWFDEDARIEVPPGGRAVVVLARDDTGLIDPGPAGGAERIPVAGGILARSVEPGGAVAGVPVVADPRALRPKTGPSHRRPCGGGPC